jgi:hypothetical protein
VGNKAGMKFLDSNEENLCNYRVKIGIEMRYVKDALFFALRIMERRGPKKGVRRNSR